MSLSAGSGYVLTVESRVRWGVSSVAGCGVEVAGLVEGRPRFLFAGCAGCAVGSAGSAPTDGWLLRGRVGAMSGSGAELCKGSAKDAEPSVTLDALADGVDEAVACAGSTPKGEEAAERLPRGMLGNLVAFTKRSATSSTQHDHCSHHTSVNAHCVFIDGRRLISRAA